MPALLTDSGNSKYKYEARKTALIYAFLFIPGCSVGLL